MTAEFSNPASSKTNSIPIRVRILIVEDDAPSRWALSTLIKRLGFDCKAAANGLEGVDLACSFHPHLIFMDLMMPVLDGRGAIRRLKEDGKTRAIPICVMTAEVSRGLEQEVRDLGCACLFPKPLAWGKLAGFLGDYFPGLGPGLAFLC